MELVKLSETSKTNMMIVQEEYGYKDFLWECPFSEVEMILFWRSVSAIDTMAPLKDIPGKMVEVDYEDDEVTAIYTELNSKPHYFLHVNADDDSFLRLPNGMRVFHKGAINAMYG